MMFDSCLLVLIIVISKNQNLIERSNIQKIELKISPKIIPFYLMLLII